MHSPAGIIHFASHSAPQVFGSSLEITGSNLLDRVHQDDSERLRKLFTDAALNGEKVPPLTVRLHSDKQQLSWVVLFTVAVKDGSGKVIELHTTLRDVTQQVALRDRIVEHDTLSDMTNVLAKVGGWYADVSNGNVYWTDEMKRLYEVGDDFQPTGLDIANCLADRNLRKFCSAEDYERMCDATRSVVKTGTPAVIEMPIKTATGSLRWVRTFLSTAYERGQIDRIYGATQDISAIKEREDEMEKLVRELTYQRDSLEEFGHLVSHQLRAPLTTVADNTSPSVNTVPLVPE